MNKRKNDFEKSRAKNKIISKISKKQEKIYSFEKRSSLKELKILFENYCHLGFIREAKPSAFERN
jgi:hypothetical protein